MGAVLNTSDHPSYVVRSHRCHDGQDCSGMFSNWGNDFATPERKGLTSLTTSAH